MKPAEEFAAKRLEAEQLIRQHAPERLQDQLITLLRPAIALTATRTDDAQIPIGASKFGGAPDVPIDFVWPMWNDKPLGFLAQVNLEEVAAFDVEGLLPKSGLLLFFLLLDEQNPVWGEPEQRQGWRVLFALEPLRRIEPPADSQWIAPLITQRINFDQSWTINDSFDYSEWEEDELSDFQGETLERLPYRMMGYAFAPQLSPLIIAANGSQSKSGFALYEEGVSTDEWLLLLQLDTSQTNFFDGQDNLGWLYFLIHRDDLRKGDFANVWFNEQCT